MLEGWAPGVDLIQCRGQVDPRASRLRASRQSDTPPFLAWSIFPVQRDKVPMSEGAGID
jgi:hypothetical protein